MSSRYEEDKKHYNGRNSGVLMPKPFGTFRWKLGVEEGTFLFPQKRIKIGL